MKQEHKELLLKDLSSRLPYGVKISVNDKVETLQGIDILDNVVEYDSFLSSNIEEVKPYLFPLSSMTEEQKKEWHSLMICDSYGILYHTIDSFDYLYKNHIDIRGLIPMGLANDATRLNIYQLCDSTKVKCKLRTPLPNNPKITIGTKIRLKTNPDIILSIVSNDCHEDKFECSNGSVLSLKQIEKYYDII